MSEQVKQIIRNAYSYRSPAEEQFMDELCIDGKVPTKFEGWSALSCKNNPLALAESKANGKYDGAFCKSPSSCLKFA